MVLCVDSAQDIDNENYMALAAEVGQVELLVVERCKE